MLDFYFTGQQTVETEAQQGLALDQVKLRWEKGHNETFPRLGT